MLGGRSCPWSGESAVIFGDTNAPKAGEFQPRAGKFLNIWLSFPILRPLPCSFWA